MLFTHPFKAIFLFLCLTTSFNCPYLTADTEEDEGINHRLLIPPPTEEDYSLLLRTIDNELIALRAKNYEKAYFVYTSKEFKRVTPLQTFLKFVKSNPVLENNKSLSIIEIYISNKIGYYKGTIISQDGIIKTINYQLTLENGEWKILGCQITP